MRGSGDIPRTQIKIKPTGSHAFVVTIAVIGGFCLLTGFSLLQFGSAQYAAVPIIIGLLMQVGAYVAWWHSQRDVDLIEGIPTTITDTYTGMQLTTDTRAILAPESVTQIARLFGMMAHRQPLPEPDGLVDARGAPVPETKADAVAKVKVINDEIETNTMQAIRALAGVNKNAMIEQPLTLEQPSEEMVMHHNRPTEGDN